MRYAALTHPTQESGFIKSTILSLNRDISGAPTASIAAWSVFVLLLSRLFLVVSSLLCP